MGKHQSIVRVAVIFLILVLTVVFVYSGGRIADKVFRPRGQEQSTTASKTIVKDGVEYFPRQDITVFMLMGIDRNGKVEESVSYNNTGAADMVALAIFDETEESINVLMLNRDTVLEIPVLGLGGCPAGTTTGQLALAHTYGTGLKDSCENTKTAVSNLLNGLKINYYLSMNMDTVSLLNDAVGGVKVTVTEDFSAVDPTIPMGEVTLKGSQAFNFVQNRKDVGSEMNISRMERQRGYMRGFMKALSKKMESGESFVSDTYAKIEDYIVTDMTVNSMSAMFNRYADYELLEVVTPEGENKQVDGFMEFHPDAEKLEDLLLRLFYAKKKI